MHKKFQKRKTHQNLHAETKKIFLKKCKHLEQQKSKCRKEMQKGEGMENERMQQL